MSYACAPVSPLGGLVATDGDDLARAGHGGRMGEEGGATTPARIVENEVVGVLAERVEVVTVEQRPDSHVLITIRLPVGMTEQARLATQEWVQLQLIALEGAAQAPDGPLYVPLYI